MQRIRHIIILVCLRMPQLLQSAFQPLQLCCWKIPVLDRADDCLHHILANIVRTIHVIEIVIMLVFYKVGCEDFEHFD